jgi:hypothetical protein
VLLPGTRAEQQANEHVILLALRSTYSAWIVPTLFKKSSTNDMAGHAIISMRGQFAHSQGIKIIYIDL